MKLHLVGGFLGSGKTTAILQAAQILVARGKKVGIITNEQGKHLVDTGLFHSQSLPALEVTGGCICCHLDDFNQRVDDLIKKYDPDVIFAESVGSCTDLVATVIKPLLDLRRDFSDPASLSVFTDSRLFYRYLKGLEMPFSEGVVYIFEKQLEESELVIINKIDLLDDEKVKELIRLAQDRYPHKSFRLQNSLESSQVEEWLELLDSPRRPVPTVSLVIDYDQYAAGEQRFSWVDRHLKITLAEEGQKRKLADCILEIGRTFRMKKLKLAHLKFLVDDGTRAIKYSVTALDDIEEKLAQLSAEIAAMEGLEYDLWINSMLENPLETVEQSIDTIIHRQFDSGGIDYEIISGFTRVPGYPKPTRRIAN
jgi:Ni2+-binding GTPase involved in maturation of urease and hydrogenase